MLELELELELEQNDHLYDQFAQISLFLLH
jgi:hypothetical protein